MRFYLELFYAEELKPSMAGVPKPATRPTPASIAMPPGSHRPATESFLRPDGPSRTASPIARRHDDGFELLPQRFIEPIRESGSPRSVLTRPLATANHPDDSAPEVEIIYNDDDDVENIEVLENAAIEAVADEDTDDEVTNPGDGLAAFRYFLERTPNSNAREWQQLVFGRVLADCHAAKEDLLGNSDKRLAAITVLEAKMAAALDAAQRLQITPNISFMRLFNWANSNKQKLATWPHAPIDPMPKLEQKLKF